MEINKKDWIEKYIKEDYAKYPFKREEVNWINTIYNMFKVGDKFASWFCVGKLTAHYADVPDSSTITTLLKTHKGFRMCSGKPITWEKIEIDSFKSIKCPRCKEDDIIKSGISPLKKQQYKCLLCNKRFVLEPEESVFLPKYPETTIAEVLLLHNEGLSQRKICDKIKRDINDDLHKDLNPSTITRWIKEDKLQKENIVDDKKDVSIKTPINKHEKKKRGRLPAPIVKDLKCVRCGEINCISLKRGIDNQYKCKSCNRCFIKKDENNKDDEEEISEKELLDVISDLYSEHYDLEYIYDYITDTFYNYRNISKTKVAKIIAKIKEKEDSKLGKEEETEKKLKKELPRTQMEIKEKEIIIKKGDTKIKITGTKDEIKETLKTKKEKRIENFIPTLNELRKMLDVSSLEMKFRILFLVQTGMRTSDALALRVGDIERELNLGKVPMAITYLPKKDRVAVGERVTFLGSDGFELLKRYLEWRKTNGEEVTSKSPLFVSRTNRGKKAVSQEKFNLTLKNAQKIAGINTELGILRARSLKKFFINQLINHGVEESIVDFMSCKKVPEADRVYWSRNIEELREIYNKCQQYLNPFNYDKESSLDKSKGIDENIKTLDIRVEELEKEKPSNINKKVTMIEKTIPNEIIELIIDLLDYYIAPGSWYDDETVEDIEQIIIKCEEYYKEDEVYQLLLWIIGTFVTTCGLEEYENVTFYHKLLKELIRIINREEKND